MATAISNQMRHRVAQAAHNLGKAALAAHEALEKSGGDVIILSPIWGALATMRRNVGMLDAMVPGGVRLAVVVTDTGWSSVGGVAGTAVVKNSTVEEGPEVALERGAAAVAAMLGL